MNTVVISKEAILSVSRELIRTQGWESINMRTVAKECNISIGSIYNYFHSKSDLVASTVESVWCDIFHFSETEEAMESFLSCVEWAFDSMKKGDEKYPGFFNLHAMSFVGVEKSNGQQMMMQSWKHIQEGLHMVLLNDKNVRKDAFDENFTPEKFVNLVFSLIVAALLRHDYDCSGISGMIRRVIYE